MRRRGRIWAGAGLLAAGIVLALAPIWAGGGSGRTITVGAKNFSEQYVLARVIGHRLEAAGYRVRYREGLGRSEEHTSELQSLMRISFAVFCLKQKKQ